ncbi:MULTISPECIES: hypothetical protein [Amycolatopsis]|uniref:hypothetical protein n=1 Tax=Amycolatopsis TaxID=1813 RepID=UPI001C58172D|nr:hypothetical protein [Amycolatopsis sp. TNS106]
MGGGFVWLAGFSGECFLGEGWWLGEGCVAEGGFFGEGGGSECALGREVRLSEVGSISEFRIAEQCVMTKVRCREGDASGDGRLVEVAVVE